MTAWRDFRWEVSLTCDDGEKEKEKEKEKKKRKRKKIEERIVVKAKVMKYEYIALSQYQGLVGKDFCSCVMQSRA